MSVTLSPASQLGFQRPLTQLVKRTLSVSNHNSQAIAYKVKTTAPKQYCVRPNSGRIEPGETVEVQVLLQPMKEDPAPGAKCRDKFLVQSVIITPERENVALAELWSVVEKDDKERADGTPSQIFEQKIRCAYLPAADSEAQSSIPEETSSAMDASRTSAMDASFASTINQGTQQPSQPASTISASSPNPADTTTSTPPPASSLAPVADKARDMAAAASGAAAGAAAAVGLPGVANAIERNAPIPSTGGPAYLSATSPSAPQSAAATTTTSSSSTGITPSGSSDELSRLRSELSAAQAEIARLKKQLDASETTAATLRARGAGAIDRSSSSKDASTAQAVVDLKGQEGVPVQVVAGIAFGVFVVTWLFF